MLVEIRRRIDDIPTEVTISLLSGYAGYLPAEHLGVSGVLAAVTTGIVLGWKAPEISTASMRSRATRCGRSSRSSSTRCCSC